MHFRLSPDHGLLVGKSGSSEPLDIASAAAREDTAVAVAALSGGENLRFADSSDLESALSILTSDIASSSSTHHLTRRGLETSLRFGY